MTRYAVRQRQMLPLDGAWLVVDEADWGMVEGVRETRELAQALADRLTRWMAAKPLDDTAAVWADPADLAAIVDGLALVEPSVQRVRELERQRLVLAQGMAA